MIMSWAVSHGQDNSAVPGVHAMGNGNLCVYGRQADIMQAFGPPYSAPAIFSLSAVNVDSVASNRIGRTAVWQHRLFDGKIAKARFTDFVAVSANVFVRRMDVSDTLQFILEYRMEDRYRQYENGISVRQDSRRNSLNGVSSCQVVEIEAGTPFYNDYRSPRGYWYRLVTVGPVEMVPDPESTRKYLMKLLPGESVLYLIAGESESDLETQTQTVENISVAHLLKATEKDWKTYSSRQRDFSTANLSRVERKRFERAVDDVATLIRSQQGRQGGTLAGIVYHMAYVRDQYGVSRALLALGHHEEARAILEFYYDVWEKYGCIHNAQAIGYDGMFHRHENDETEITGYLVVQAFDYYRATGDDGFLKEIMPMLEWAGEVQQKHIIDGMLPFNGDETYIAGGVVPRKIMYNGSAEATLLFIEGSCRLLDFVGKHSLWDTERIGRLRAVTDECMERYRDNFFVDGKLHINNPDRELKVEYPASRPGVCLHPQHNGYATETYHFRGPLYFCESCMTRDNSDVRMPEPERFTIPSAYLFPIYINAGLFTEAEKQELLDAVVDRYRETGKISSVDNILGYDYGLFLYALASRRHELAGEVYSKMMNLRDATGAWVEYYVNGVPFGCGCRPWESGINIEAAIKYAAVDR